MAGDAASQLVAESPSAIWRRVESALGELGGGVVEGEVQQITRAASGHVYLDLSDGEARVGCVIWRSTVEALGELPRQGQLIQARYRRIRVYAPRGTVSLEVDAIRAAGEGELLRRVQESLARLVADGQQLVSMRDQDVNLETAFLELTKGALGRPGSTVSPE